MLPVRSGAGRARLLAAALMLVGCGGETPAEPVQLSADGIWRLSEAGITETTLRLAGDGSFDRVVANITDRSCVSSSGRWSADAGTLVLEATTVANQPATDSERYDLEILPDGLVLADGALPGRYVPRAAMVTCVDYGFGGWVGSFTADIDGAPIDFQIVSVRLDVDRGDLLVEGRYEGCAFCPVDRRRIVVSVDGGPGPLEPRTFTVQNVPGASDTMYGLYHPDPDSQTFSGFDTTRLSPTGALTLTSVAGERIAGTFEFRGNPRVDGEVGPAGETFVLVDDGRIDLEYR